MAKIILLTVFCFVALLLNEVKTVDEPVIQTTKLLTYETFDEDIESGLTFVLFYVNWCTQSRKIFPIWNQLGEKYKDHAFIKIRRVDLDHEATNNMYYKQKVNGSPTINIYKNGTNYYEYTGKTTVDDIVKAIEIQLLPRGMMCMPIDNKFNTNLIS